jgi:hypothetical protein
MEAILEAGLRKINVEMAAHETNGDRAYFDELLAPAFGLRRASGAFEDRQIFLAGLRRGSPRECDPGSVSVTTLNDERAFVTCLVTMQGKVYSNARLFVLDATRSWRLLAWANEQAKPTP